MRQHRVYTMGRVDGDFIGVRSFECPDDATAIQHARQTMSDYSVELWQLDRFVTKLHKSSREREFSSPRMTREN